MAVSVCGLLLFHFSFEYFIRRCCVHLFHALKRQDKEEEDLYHVIHAPMPAPRNVMSRRQPNKTKLLVDVDSRFSSCRPARVFASFLL